MNNSEFDVFLSHNSRDKDAVEQIALRLEQQEATTAWLDKWELTPGTSSLEGIERGLKTSQSCAVFLGEAGFGPWHELERRAAITRLADSRGEYRVIPVLLPGVAEPNTDALPLFLRDLAWVKFRSLDPLDEAALQLLLCGIRGTKPKDFLLRRKAEAIDDPREKVVPHGLRSFSERDSRFFLRLLPGARDHRGLPENIAFWKDRLEEADPARTFAVGLLHGPSGCGKSSLVKAGLLPRLAEYVRPVYLEATPDDTERQLLAGLRKQTAGLPADLDLPMSLAYLHEHPASLEGCKLVLILDQFEQWLHSNRITADSPLITALRHCDGSRLQAVLLVRTDFSLEIHRFLSALGVRIQEDVNMRLVDLFDQTHARRVLMEFGRAYDRLPDADQLTDEQQTFLDQAVTDLSDDKDRLVAVQIALLTHMLRNKDWTASVLRKIGGAARVGRVFLEESFDDPKTASPTARAHGKGAIAVLKKLLPQRGADLKGSRQTRSALREVAGYTTRPNKEFADLLDLLRKDRCLISPSAADEEESTAANDDPSYQLTHDYLVPSIRDWLAVGDGRSYSGRARMILEERAEQWHRESQPRHLPTFSELARISLLVPCRDRTEPQRKLLHAARRFYGIRAVIFSASLLAVMIPILAWAFCTFDVVFADQKYLGQRNELIIIRKLNLFGYEMGTGIFREELRDFKAENKINRRMTLSTGLAPDWRSLEPLLSDARISIAEIEWLDRPISLPKHILVGGDFELTALTRASPEVIDVLVTLLKDQDDNVRSRAAASLVQLGKSDTTVIDALIRLLRVPNPYVRSRAATLLVPLGKTDPAGIDALVSLLEDQDSYVSYHAAAALVQLGKSDEAVIKALVKLLEDPMSDIGDRAAAALVQSGKNGTVVIDALIRLLRVANPYVRSRAAASLVQLGKSDAAVIDTLVELLKNPYSEIRSRAATLLVQLGKCDTTVIDTLVELLKDPNGDVHSRAAASLVQLGKSDAVDALVTLLKYQHRYDLSSAGSEIATVVMLLTHLEDNVRYHAAASLVQLGKSDPAVIDALITLLKDQDRIVRTRAAAALGQLGKSDPAVISALVTLLNNPDDNVRSSVAAALGHLGKYDPAVIDALVTLLKDQASDVRSSAETAVGQLGQTRPDWTVERMIEDLADYDSGVRERAGIVLAWRDERLKPQTVESIRELRKDSRPWVRQAALHALYHIEKRKLDREEEAASKKAQQEAAAPK